MGNPAGKPIREFNRLMWEMDALYRRIIRQLGLSESAFWILYALRADGENGESMTLSQIGRLLFQSKQTLHSALKKLEAEELVRLTGGADRRSKYVVLTPKGMALASRTADRLIAAENAAFAGLGEGEQSALLGLMGRFAALLEDGARQMEGEK